MDIPATPLTRFAVEGGKIKDDVVKPKLFEPNRQNELSVFRTGGLSQHEVGDLGLQVVGKHPKASRLHGWARIERDDVENENTGLRVIDDDNPPRHSNIIGWPKPKERAKVLSLMQSLASKASPHLLDSPKKA